VRSALSQDGELALVYAGSSSGLMRFRWIDAEWNEQRVDERSIERIDSVWVDSYWDQSLVTYGVSTAPADLFWIDLDPGSNAVPIGSGAVSRGIQARTIRTGSNALPVRQTHTTRSGETTAVFGDTGNVAAWQDEQRWIEAIGVGPSLATVDFTDELFAFLIVDNQGNLRSRFADLDSLSEQLILGADPAITSYDPAQIALAEVGDIAYASWTGESALGKVGFVAQWKARTWTTFNLGLVKANAPRLAVNAAGDAIVAWAKCEGSACTASGVVVTLWARDGEFKPALSNTSSFCSQVGEPVISVEAQRWFVPIVCDEKGAFVVYPGENGIEMPEVPAFGRSAFGLPPQVVVTPSGNAALVTWAVLDDPGPTEPVALYGSFLRFDVAP
jgi:hypothetical protein